MTHLRLSTLRERLECPRCSRVPVNADLESFRGNLTCVERRRCGQHWWAMRLEPGDVLVQLVPVFGEDLARENMQTWSLPATMREPMYWQLMLTQNLFEVHGARGSRDLIRELLALFRVRKSLAPRAQPT